MPNPLEFGAVCVEDITVVSNLNTTFSMKEIIERSLFILFHRNTLVSRYKCKDVQGSFVDFLFDTNSLNGSHKLKDTTKIKENYKLYRRFDDIIKEKIHENAYYIFLKKIFSSSSGYQEEKTSLLWRHLNGLRDVPSIDTSHMNTPLLFKTMTIDDISIERNSMYFLIRHLLEMQVKNKLLFETAYIPLFFDIPWEKKRLLFISLYKGESDNALSWLPREIIEYIIKMYINERIEILNKKIKDYEQ